MYYDETRSLIKNITIWACICLVVAGVLFVVSNELVDAREQRAYERFLEFLESVNSGAYDNKKAGYPPEFRIWSFERCFDDSRYLWGKLDGYSFQGYTSSSNPVSRMNWTFTGYPTFSLEGLMQTFAVGGLAVTAFSFLPGLGYVSLKMLRKFFG